MRSQRFARGVLIASAVAFAGPGAGFLLFPERLTAAVDVALLSPTGASDVRAVMGGLELGIGMLLAWAARSGSLRAALLLLLAALGGLLLGRCASFFADGSPGALAWLLFAVEGVLFAAGFSALRGLSEDERASG